MRSILVVLSFAGVLSASTITETFTADVTQACDGACEAINFDIPQSENITGPVQWTFTDSQSYEFVNYFGYPIPGVSPDTLYTTTEGDVSNTLDMIVSASQQTLVTDVIYGENQLSASGTLDPSLLEGNGMLVVGVTPDYFLPVVEPMNYIVTDDETLTFTYDPPGTSAV